MSTDLNINTGSLDARIGSINTDLRIGQYEFFTGYGENRYLNAIEGEQTRQIELREETFTPAFPGGVRNINGAEQVKQMSILEISPEYTQGLYNETGNNGSATAMLVLLFVCICAITFLITRGIHVLKRKKTENVYHNND